MKSIQKSTIVLFLVLASSNIWAQNSKQITHGGFTVSKASMNGVDVTKKITKNKAYTVFYYETADSVLHMANVWDKPESQSCGPIKINNIYTTKSESDGYSETVYSFQWNFENTYDNNSGVVDVIFVKSYKPDGVYVSLFMKQENDDLTIY
jgi:hypothetical protein